MKGEIWKPVKGYEGLYEVSNMGRVKSLERTIWTGRGYYKTLPERIMKLNKDRYGYLLVNLHKDGKKKTCKVHRLVATAFLPNPENLPCINHRDENKRNNLAQNLEWCDCSYNNNYGTRTAKTYKPVFSVDRETGLIMYWESITEAERCTGIYHGSIIKCCQGKRNSAGNHYWFYADDDDNE